MSRPRFHYTPPSGWMNDPVGITWHDGRYHLFFQHVPGSTSWQMSCHWGHASSTDLLTWDDHPVALAPGDGDLGCWSGCLGVTDHGAATILYTSVADEWRIGRIRAATPTDGSWETWRKGGVVVDAPSAIDDLHEFRDPFVFREGDQWRLLVGAGHDDGTASVLTYTSPMAALTDWTYDGVLASRDGSLHDPVWTGHAWECPQLLEIDGHHVLIVSVWSADVTHYVAAAVGEYAEGRFEARQWHRLTFGAHYAGTTFRDAKGAPCLLLWVRDVEDLDAGWAGAQSIPLRLGVADGRLTVAAHPVLDQHPVASVAGWTPVDGAELTAVSGSGRTLATLTGAGDHVVVRVGTGEPTELPVVADRVQVIVDGPILEVVTRHATYASGIDARGETVLLERPS